MKAEIKDLIEKIKKQNKIAFIKPVKEFAENNNNKKLQITLSKLK